MALTSTVLPVATFGVELWGLPALLHWVRNGRSPFHCSRLTPVLSWLQTLAGLPSNSFIAPVYHLFGIPTMLEMLLPCLLRVLGSLSLEARSSLLWVAVFHPRGVCAAAL